MLLSDMQLLPEAATPCCLLVPTGCLLATTSNLLTMNNYTRLQNLDAEYAFHPVLQQFWTWHKFIEKPLHVQVGATCLE